MNAKKAETEEVVVLGPATAGGNLKLQLRSFLTHMFITGMTGSGKTGTIMVVIEELIRRRVPVVLFDLKGDLLNIAMTRPTQDGKALRDMMAVRVLTPGAFYGEPVNLLSGLNDPDPDNITSSVAALLKVCGIDKDTVQSPEHSFLAQILKTRHAHNQSCTLVDLIYAVQEPEFTMLGAMPLEAVFPPTKRMKLAEKLNTVMCDPDFEKWRSGAALDFNELLAEREDGRVPVIVYQTSHIVEDAKRDFALAVGLEALWKYTKASGGSPNLRAVAVIDELAGLVPPTPYNPPTKKPIMTMLKQARAFGVGLVLATQNPVDLDYKGLSNVGSWVIGRLQTNHDRERVIEGVCSTGSYNPHQLHKLMGGLQQREFLCIRSNIPVPFSTKDVHVQLAGPLGISELQKLYEQGRLVPVDKAAILMSRLAEARALYSYDEAAWEDRVRAIELALVRLGHKEVLEDSPLDHAGDLVLADHTTDGDGLIARSSASPPKPVKKVSPGIICEEKDEEPSPEEKLRAKLDKKDVKELAEKAVKLHLFANVTAARTVRKPGLIDALVRHEMIKKQQDELLSAD